MPASGNGPACGGSAESDFGELARRERHAAAVRLSAT
jgi:hypothetical protein